MEAHIKVVSLSKCEFRRKTGVLLLSSQELGGVFPRHFIVQSHHTGKEVRFVAIGPEDKLFCQDGWDGEQQVYRPVGNVPAVDHLVVHRFH